MPEENLEVISFIIQRSGCIILVMNSFIEFFGFLEEVRLLYLTDAVASSPWLPCSPMVAAPPASSSLSPETTHLSDS